jgi:hypothetical protein
MVGDVINSNAFWLLVSYRRIFHRINDLCGELGKAPLYPGLPNPREWKVQVGYGFDMWDRAFEKLDLDAVPDSATNDTPAAGSSQGCLIVEDGLDDLLSTLDGIHVGDLDDGLGAAGVRRLRLLTLPVGREL